MHVLARRGNITRFYSICFWLYGIIFLLFCISDRHNIIVLCVNFPNYIEDCGCVMMQYISMKYVSIPACLHLCSLMLSELTSGGIKKNQSANPSLQKLTHPTLNSLTPERFGSNLYFSNSVYQLICQALPMKLVWGERHNISLMLSQHWFR